MLHGVHASANPGLIEAMKGNRWGHRDATMVFLAYRHGLRAAELVDLRWEQIELANALLHVRRVKQGSPANLQREQQPKSPFVFISERGVPFSKRGFQAMVERAAKAAGFEMKIHPHMLGHACGFKLANEGVDTRTIQAYLGHRSNPAYRSLYRAGADPLQIPIPRLTGAVEISEPGQS